MGAKTKTAKIASTALAKIIFFDGESLLARGDVKAAIAQFREAISHDNTNDHYYYQLALALAMEESTRSEAREMLLKAIALNNKNPDYHSQLALINNKNKPEKAKIALKEACDEPVPLKSYKIETKSKSKRRRQSRYWGREQVVRRSTFSLINLLVLAFIGAFTLAALSISYKATRIEIKPFMPKDQATVENTKIEFRWGSSVENIDYLIQIELNGKKLVEKYIRDSMYVPTGEELKKFKPGYRYKWRVLPVSPKRQPLAFKTVDREFRVSLAE